MCPSASWRWLPAGAAGLSSACRPRQAGFRVVSGRWRSRSWGWSSCSTGKADLGYLRVALLLLGAALLAVLVAQNDPAAIVGSIADLSWRLAVILCFPAVLVAVFDTLGWRFAFLRNVRFRVLFASGLAAGAFHRATLGPPGR